MQEDAELFLGITSGTQKSDQTQNLVSSWPETSQTAGTSPAVAQAMESPEEKRKRTLKLHGWLFLVGGLIASGIIGIIKPGSWNPGDDPLNINSQINSQFLMVVVSMFTTACWIIGIVDLIRAACVKTKKSKR